MAARLLHNGLGVQNPAGGSGVLGPLRYFSQASSPHYSPEQVRHRRGFDWMVSASVAGPRETFASPSLSPGLGSGRNILLGSPNSGPHGQHALMYPSFPGSTLLGEGTDGPKGCVLVLLSEALMATLIAVIYRKRKFPLLPDQIRIGEVRASQK